MKENFTYQKRRIQFLNLLEMGEWRFKVYGITYQEGQPDSELIKAVEYTVKDRISQIPSSLKHYNIGFIGIHDGKTANFVFVDWWADENELHHHVYVSPKDNPGKLEYKTPTGLTACVWDLELINHERDAWVKTVLHAEEPGFDKYLHHKYNGYA